MQLYIHIPFCVRKCLYCDFYSLAGKRDAIGAYVSALIAEMALRPLGETLKTIYLGGGTPSLLPPEELSRLLYAVRERYTILPDAEITAEVNPGTLTREWLIAAREGGINRLSIGVQAVQDALLQRIGRIHTRADADLAVEMAREAGFGNISVDLMAALPGQTLGDLLESLLWALDKNVSHVSCYTLIVEPNTPFFAQREAGALAEMDDDAQLAMLALVRDTLLCGGLRQYEISNYTLPGKESRHNLGYWQREPYLGLGCAAHSFVDGARFCNPADLGQYLNALQGGRLASSVPEPVSADDAALEELMLGLRMLHGVALSPHAEALYGKKIAVMEQKGFLQRVDGRLCLTAKGLPVMDAVLEFLL